MSHAYKIGDLPENQHGKSPRLRLCGVPVDLLNKDDILALLQDSVRNNARIVLANINLHGWYVALRHSPVLKLMNEPETFVHVDGMPIAWIAGLFGIRNARSVRWTHIDLIPHMLELCQKNNWRVAFVGGRHEHAEENMAAVRGIAPHLEFKAFSGFFDIDDFDEKSVQFQTIKEINAFSPALLMVGMGMPRQEVWISRIRNRLESPLVMPVGGFLDYFAGRTAHPPRVLGKLGFEWLYRLSRDPKRLASRYLIEPFFLGAFIAFNTVRGASWGLERRNDKRARE